ncbi:hypothetical protein HDK90DRAFT_480245 [Phyllosticta capitalensis]|uniref:Gfd2/YDR514C-like C-terminal domain-containing protein n=1 Tax=Phyllosticta capitalensis TaxID=121624 RepID=A0ABR1YWW5_9PEZI
MVASRMTYDPDVDFDYYSEDRLRAAIFSGFNSLKDDQELFRSDQPRRVILVFHDLSNELEKLHEIGFDCTENEVIGAADTQRLNGTDIDLFTLAVQEHLSPACETQTPRARKENGQPDTKVTFEAGHNAGVNAFWTLRCLGSQIVKGIPVTTPAVSPLETPPILMAVDTEGWEWDDSILTEVGVSILDLAQVQQTPPGFAMSEWLNSHQETYHWIFKEHDHPNYRNRDFLVDRSKNFPAHMGHTATLLKFLIGSAIQEKLCLIADQLHLEDSNPVLSCIEWLSRPDPTQKNHSENGDLGDEDHASKPNAEHVDTVQDTQTQTTEKLIATDGPDSSLFGSTLSTKSRSQQHLDAVIAQLRQEYSEEPSDVEHWDDPPVYGDDDSDRELSKEQWDLFWTTKALEQIWVARGGDDDDLDTYEDDPEALLRFTCPDSLRQAGCRLGPTLPSSQEGQWRTSADRMECAAFHVCWDYNNGVCPHPTHHDRKVHIKWTCKSICLRKPCSNPLECTRGHDFPEARFFVEETRRMISRQRAEIDAIHLQGKSIDKTQPVPHIPSF